MENVTLDFAKEHLEELLERAANGGEVHIKLPAAGTVKLVKVADDPAERPAGKRRKRGRLAGKIEVPEGLLDPMTEEELKDWYGE